MSQIELKINAELQNTSASMSDCFVCSKGKGGTANAPDDRFILQNLANDNTEVRGFGQPITPGLAKSIVVQYINKSNDAWDVIDKINRGIISDITEIKDHPGFSVLKSMLSPEYQIVSGVFGKEIILNLISQKDCEGIRYSIGEMVDFVKDENGQVTSEQLKMTVVLTGVKEVEKANPADKAQSVPLGGLEHYKNANSDVTIAPDTEVHGSSLTRSQLATEINNRVLLSNESAENKMASVLFGVY